MESGGSSERLFVADVYREKFPLKTGEGRNVFACLDEGGGASIPRGFLFSAAFTIKQLISGQNLKARL